LGKHGGHSNILKKKQRGGKKEYNRNQRKNHSQSETDSVQKSFGLVVKLKLHGTVGGKSTSGKNFPRRKKNKWGKEQSENGKGKKKRKKAEGIPRERAAGEEKEKP